MARRVEAAPGDSLSEPLLSDAYSKMEWLDQWNKKINGNQLGMKYGGAYYQFQTPEAVLSAGSDGPKFGGDTPCALTSCTKLFTGMALMRSMYLKPADWYPEKEMHQFEGWEEWKDFAVLDNVDNSDGVRGWSGKVANVTVHQLATHTSGWPFGLRGNRARIREVALYFEPGTKFGYSIGHRILGWMMLDYWKTQPEGAGFKNLNDVFKFLVFDPLMISPNTCFIKGTFKSPHSIMGEYFDMSLFDIKDEDDDDDPADLSMQSTGADMMKVAMVALRRGLLPDGSVYIPPLRWNEWAATNKLPGGKLSSALANWRMEGYSPHFLLRTAVTRTTNSGPFGWSYFGATYHDYEGDGDAGVPIAIGWKGFSSCGLRADYSQNIAFVAVQECVPDPGNRNFAECIHKGRVGDYSLGDVGRWLARGIAEGRWTDESMEEDREETRAPCNPFHSVNMEVEDPSCCLSCAQNVLRCGYRFGLPLVVHALDFHQTEELDADSQ
mmetsp:Transcript_70164/g.205241  ORF Transcript_70164/g.205241 Transcript_70164/m.205241 type:complete len:495 (-) Transcript_70164:84-1568(-)